MLTPAYEHTLFAKGYSRIVGIDEVGRGSWAGPLAMGAFVFTADMPVISGIKDSKQLSAQAREEVARVLDEYPHSIHYQSAAEIDQHGLAHALHSLVKEIVTTYQSDHTYFLLDGKFGIDLPPNLETHIKGDTKFYAIAAASILAKVARDELMDQLNLKHPGYNWDTNKGYGTSQHIQQIQTLGLSPAHRRSFALKWVND